MLCVLRCIVHPAGNVTIDNAFKLMVENTLLHCIVVEKGVGDEIIHLLEAILKTCSFAGVKSN
jgi:hypothetical protein